MTETEDVRKEIEERWGRAKPRFTVTDWLQGMNAKFQSGMNIRIKNIAAQFTEISEKKIRTMDYADFQQLSRDFSRLYSIPEDADFLLKE